MYRKQIKLNAQGCFSEVDPIARRRYSQQLKDYIEASILQEQDPYDVRGQVQLLCDSILAGQIVLPLDYDALPLSYVSREGLLPEGFSRPWAKFIVNVTGMLNRLSEPVLIDGIRYCETDFEEPGDWPEWFLRRETEGCLELLASDNAIYKFS